MQTYGLMKCLSYFYLELSFIIVVLVGCGSAPVADEIVRTVPSTGSETRLASVTNQIKELQPQVEALMKGQQTLLARSSFPVQENVPSYTWVWILLGVASLISFILGFALRSKKPPTKTAVEGFPERKRQAA